MFSVAAVTHSAPASTLLFPALHSLYVLLNRLCCLQLFVRLLHFSLYSGADSLCFRSILCLLQKKKKSNEATLILLDLSVFHSCTQHDLI